MKHRPDGQVERRTNSFDSCHLYEARCFPLLEFVRFARKEINQIFSKSFKTYWSDLYSVQDKTRTFNVANAHESYDNRSMTLKRGYVFYHKFLRND